LLRIGYFCFSECFVHLQVAALQQARQVWDMGAWHFMPFIFLQGAILLGVKIIL
jgi:hypothetical protein